MANYQAALVKDFQTGTRDWPNGSEGRCKCGRGSSRSCSLVLVICLAANGLIN
jgi:hypothetical protein